MPVTSKVAFVVDALPGLGGAEKTVMAALELFPDAPIYTLIYNREKFENTPIACQQVETSFIQHLPLTRHHYRKYLPIMPFAVEQFDLSKYETILSFSYAVANGVKVCTGQKLLSYTFTPMRYAWSNMGLDGKQRRPSLVLDRIFEKFREWDRKAVSRVLNIATISNWIADWVWQAYHKKSRVIYPPVEIERFSSSEDREKYFISVSRLVSHKRIDLLVDAFNCLKLPLVIIGDGPERSNLERRAAKNIRFLGFQPDTVINHLLNRARAFISSSREDFGIAMVEAQSAGCPVIAFGVGGAREIVLENQTGIFFEEDIPGSLISAVDRFNMIDISSHECAVNAMRFNRKRFILELRTFVESS